MPDIRAAILAAARSRSTLSYRLDPPPDGVTTTDCSLLVVDSARDGGAPLPPGVRTAEHIRQAVQAIENDDVQPADLIFFAGTYPATGQPGPDGLIASHVGFSLGRGTGQMLDAHERDGADVGITDIRTTYWTPKIIGFGRLPALALAAEATPAPAVQVSGIDVASWQGTPDWAAVKVAGYAFAWTKVTEDDDYVNPTFVRNWAEIRRVGLVRGAYHYAQPEGPDAVQEADYFLARLESVGGLLPGDMVALDIEAGTGDLGQWCLSWLRRVEARAGVRPFVYTGAWFSKPHGLGNVSELGGFPLWLAAYQDAMPAPPAPWGAVTIWQHSSTGRVPGIAGDVDLNLFRGTVADLARHGLAGAVVAPGYQYIAPGEVGSGLLALMAEDGTEPLGPSTWLPLGAPTANTEEAIGLNGIRYLWHLPTGRHFRYPAA